MSMRFGWMRVLLVALAMATFGGVLSGQSTITLGNQTGATNAFPFNYSNSNGRFQSAYAPADLPIVAGGLIVEVRVFGSTLAAPQYGNLRLRMGYTTNAVNAMTPNFDTNIVGGAGGLTTCLGPVNFTPTATAAAGGTWYNFPLATPFAYNGTGTLVVDWSYDTRSAAGFTISATTTAPAPEQVRSRVYLNGGDYQSPAGTAAINGGNYGIQFVHIPPGNGVVLGNQSSPQDVISGPQTDLAMVRMVASAFGTSQTLNSIMFTKSGTLSNASIGTIKLVHDVNANDAVDGGDVVLSQGSLAGNTILFSTGAGFPLPVPTTGGPKLLLAVTSASNWPVGATVEFSLAAATAVVWSGGTDFTGYPLSSGLWTVVPPPMSGDYTINQTSGNFTNIGAAFDALEAVGVVGPVTLTITDSATYTANSSYSLGLDATGATVIPIPGISATNRITLRAAPGQTPVVVGSATGALMFTPLTGRGSIAIMSSYVTVDGLTLTGGPNFGIMIQGNNTGLRPVSNVVRRCRVFGIPSGPGIAYMGQNTSYFTDGIIEHNFVWDCFTVSIPAVTVLQGITSGPGHITVRNADTASGIIRHNTVLNRSTVATVSGIAVSSASTAFDMEDVNNNIVICTSSTNPAYYAQATTHLPNPANCNRNFWFATVQCNVAPTDFAAWVVTGRDTNGSNLNPQLVSTTGTIDLHLTSTSPCRDPATQVSAATVDVDGQPRPFGATNDIGADEFYANAPIVIATPLTGSPQTVLATDTGPGTNGLAAGTFTISSTAFAPAPTLTQIGIQAAGTGFDQNAYSMVALYRDANNNSAFDFGIDTQIGGTFTAFAADNGTLNFAVQTGEQAFVPNETRRYFVVVKLAGTTLALNGHTLLTRVFSMTVGTGEFPAGAPSELMTGLIVSGPVLTAAATAGTAQTVLTTELGVGGNGIPVGTFTVTNNAVGATTLNSINISATGNADEVNTMTQVALYEDANSNSAWDFGTDSLIQSFTNFLTNNGTRTFIPAAPLPMAPSQVRRFFVVVRLGGATPATDLQTYNFTCSALAVPAGTTSVTTPLVTMLGLIIQGPVLTVTPVVPAAPQTVIATDTGPGTTGIHAATFRVTNNALGTGNMTTITVTASGSGHDLNAYTSLQLFEDTNLNDTFDVGVDPQYGATAVAFTGDNGTRSFSAARAFAPSQVRTFLLVVKLNGATLALDGQTFNYAVPTAPGVAVGTRGVGSATVMTGLVIDGALLTVALPAVPPPAVSAVPTETGPGGNGYAAGVFTVTNDAFGNGALASVTVTSSGTGNDATAYSYIAVFEDVNTNGVFDFGTDTQFGVTSFTPAFTADNGNRVFPGTASFTPLQSRQFLVVVRLNGTVLATNAQTFLLTVSASVGGNGTATTGTAAMSGTVINGPLLTATVVAGTAVSVMTTETGPGTNGFLAQSFTIDNSNSLNATLNSLTLTASGTGNDALNQTYTYLALFIDTNANGTFESGVDTQFGATLTGFAADNTTALFTASPAVTFTPAETKRILIVAKLGGPTVATNGMTFNYRLTGMTATLPTVITAPPAIDMQGIVILGPTVNFTSGAAATQNVYAHETGPGNNGIVVNSFTLSNTNSVQANFASISVTAIGTVVDNVAFSQVGLFRDVNNNSAYDFGTDTAFGATATAFGTDNGTQVFTDVGQIAPAATIRYFLVVKLNGSTLASPGQTFTFTVTAAPTFPTVNVGLPSAAQNGLTILAPEFAITDDPLTQVTGYRGTGDYVLQKFSVGYAAGPNNSLTDITIASGGSGNSATGYSAIKLFLDSNTNGTFEPATDTLLQSLPAFTANSAVFSLGAAAAFVPTNTRTFFVVGDFNSTPPHGSTFQTRISAGSVGYAGTVFTPALPLPAAFTPGVIIELPDFVFTDNSNPVVTNAFMGDPGFVLQSFTVGYPSGPGNNLGSITLTASGTGDDVAAYSALHLVVDDPLGPSPGVFDALDTVLDTVLSFASNDGQATFNLTGPGAAFNATEVKQYFVIGDFSQNGTNATTFASAVTGAGNMGFGAIATGLPTVASAGLFLLDGNLRAAFIAPGIATTVNTDSAGVNGEGNLLYEFTLATGPGSGWSISELTFVGAGTANHATAYKDLWLYEDDGNRTWDGPLLDSPAAAPLVSFTPGTFEATFELINPDTGVNSIRRFYLRGRLAGTATTGQTLNARLQDVNGAPVVGGSVRGVPLVNSTAMIVSSTALTVLSAPATPADMLRKAGTAFIHPILNVRMGASNNDVTVSEITFSNAGTGDFAASLSANGFQVWLDDGDGVFTAADSLLFQGPGAATVVASFSTPVAVPNSGTRDLWVVLDFVATAGNGATVPRTYQTVVNSPAAVVAGGGATVLLGTPAPQSNTVSLVDFFVTTFTPLADLPGGGRDITITGSGFMAPFSVLIDGVACPGAPVITGLGTQVTGLTVPPGTGLDAPITIKSGGLDSEVLSQTFDFVPLATPKAEDSSNCSIGGSAPAAWWMVAGVLPALAALRRRRKS